jgi:hypothetical protein
MEADEVIFVSKTQYKIRSAEFLAMPKCTMKKSEKPAGKRLDSDSPVMVHGTSMIRKVHSRGPQNIACKIYIDHFTAL